MQPGRELLVEPQNQRKIHQQVFQQVQENLPPPILINHEQTAQQSHTEVQMTQNQMIVNMLQMMDLQLKKMKEAMNMNQMKRKQYPNLETSPKVKQ